MSIGGPGPALFSQSTRRQRIVDACPSLTPLFERYTHAGHMPGLIFGVVVDTKLVFTQGIGTRVVGQALTPDDNTLYRIASMTKSFTAAAIVHLRDNGKLQLDDAVSAWVPELRQLTYPSTDSKVITIRDLLTMSVGWPQDDPWADRQLYRDDLSITRLYREGITFSNPPGIAFEYSNYAYIVLGRIVSAASSEPAMDYIERIFLKPLGMTSTTWRPDPMSRCNRAQGYRYEDNRWKVEQPLPNGGDLAAFAGLFCTIGDLARWVGFFLDAWPPRNSPEVGPLLRSSLREMQQVARQLAPCLEIPHVAATPEIQARGYGFGLSCTHNGRWERVGHGGGLPGFGSHMCWAPAYGVGVMALANLTYANAHDPCGDALEMLTEQTEISPRVPVASIALQNAHDNLCTLLNVWDDDLAEALFSDNFFLDQDRDHWKRALTDLREKHGQFWVDSDIQATNWLRGGQRVQGEHGWCVVWATLSPTVPPRVQTLEIQSVLPPSNVLQALADELMELTAKPRRRALDRLLSSSCDRALAWKQLRLVNITLGRCQIDAITRGDGHSFAEFSLQAGGRFLSLELHCNQRGKLTELWFVLEV